MSQKLLSVVVPTKNRYYYLEKLVELIDSFNSEELELVIQDNSDDNSSFMAFLNNRFPFVVYHHIQGQIPMSINSDNAVLNSHGEYICFIGDDDGVVRYIIDCVHWMKENDVDAVLPYIPHYFWPTAKKGRFHDNRASIHFHKFSNKIIFRNSEKELMYLIDQGFTSRGKLPLAYHGIVSRKLLDKIYKRGNTFFPGSSPDISNAVAVSLSTETYAFVDAPITISGAGQFHGGGTDNMKNKEPNLQDIPWLLSDAIENWDPKVPKIGIGEAIWCDSAIKSLKYMGRNDLVDKINFQKLYLSISAQYPSQIDNLLNEIGNPLIARAKICFSRYRKYLTIISKRLLSKLGKNTDLMIAKNVDDIIIAESFLSSHFTSPFLK